MGTLTLMGAGPELGTPFTPLSLSPIAWYDFSLLAGADGSAISTFNDGSGNAHTLTQATGTLQPLVKAGVNGINSLKVAQFDGVDDSMNTASFSFNQPFVVYGVITGGAASVVRFWTDGNLAVRCGYDNTPAPNVFGGNTLATVASAPIANPKVMTTVFNGASSLVRVDGTQVESGDIGAGNGTIGMYVGSAGSIAQWWNGKIGELLIAPGSSVSTAYEAALKTKWGTP